MVRALRAELAPEGCGDWWIRTWLDRHDSSLVDPALRSTLVGLALAARLDRLVREPPQLEAPFDEAAFREFLKTTLAAWIMEQAHAIHQTALMGARLDGYGGGVVAISAGLADLRFVDVIRTIPLPESLAQDAELSEEYYVALEQSLEPRLVRGRDAALVGLRRFAKLGVLHDPRLDRARTLLSRLFAGRRINALDQLSFPALPQAELSTSERWLAAHLPTFYAARWLGDAHKSDPGVLRALLARGVPLFLLARLEAATLSSSENRSLARALLAFGQTYWQTASFERAAALAEETAKDEPSNDEASLLRAVAKALRGGPKDAAHMMVRGPLLPKSVGDISALDKLATTDSSVAAHAAFNAGLLLALIPQQNANAAHWVGIAERFDHAATISENSGLQESARGYAAEARATAAAIEAELERAAPAEESSQSTPHD